MSNATLQFNQRLSKPKMDNEKHVYQEFTQSQQLSLQPPRVKEDPYRFVNLVIFVLLALVNSIPCYSFTPIAIQVARLYDISKDFISYFSTSYGLSSVLMVLPVNYVLDYQGFRSGIVLGSLFNILGSMVRLLIGYGFWLSFIGTLLTSLGHVFIMCAPMRLITNWFRLQQTSMINSICMISILSSTVIGNLIPVLFVNKQSSKEDILKMLIFQAILLTSISVVAILLIKDRPMIPPNQICNRASNNYFTQIGHLFRNQDYIKLFFSTVIIYGAISCFSNNLEWQITPFGFGSSQVALILVVSNLAGIIGAIISGKILSQTRIFRKLSIFTSLMIICCLIIMYFCIRQGNFLFVLLSSALSGAFILPYFTTVSEYSVQLAFPVGQSTSAGFLLTGGQLSYFIFNYAIIKLLDGKQKSSSDFAFCIYTGLLLIGLALIIRVQEKLNRTQYGRKN